VAAALLFFVDCTRREAATNVVQKVFAQLWLAWGYWHWQWVSPGGH